ncbi:hypothetical protein IAI51_22675 [Pseudomonas sp. N40(2020)]|uniref:hypothetical protein n=1 Tax=Pseudomonas sp. N40(2020) TaxID=2767798 RepID=UPI001656B8F8|nr:hypothetical protein [Pseudomonas sp. N40(2020)]MBC8999332.1 hypothetical protein [Pseudomonas sp. N40(2020)]
MMCTPRCGSDDAIVPSPAGGRKAIVAMVNIDGIDGRDLWWFGWPHRWLASDEAGTSNITSD